MKIFGQELAADVRVRGSILCQESALRRSLRAGAEALGCAVLSEHCQRFEPTGVTAVAIIGESHLLVSTYPELGIASFNIQTCSERLRLLSALEAICTVLEAESVQSLVLMRHLDVPFQVELRHANVAFRDGRLLLETGATREDAGPVLASGAFAPAN